ncbi:hypothetical protein [Nocardioides sp. SYSU D00038]|uniref:hypothetical protein n=1 Tax=Nocardioides sp. SYSU D00038 TaxID=2812554 RepID=UPI0019671F8B|nr:hypothetical protein [Nocardioides sp. SYSU D00038]
MRARRLLAAIVTTGLIAPAGAILAASPASAATPTTIVSGTAGQSWVSASNYYGASPSYGKDSVRFSINVQDAGGEQVYDGGVTVQRLLASTSTWQTVASSTSAYLYDSIPVAGTATYRVIYAGTSEFDPTSATAVIKAQRYIKGKGVSGKRTGFQGKVSPKAKVKVTVKKKVGKKFKKVKTFKTKSNGKWKVLLPAPRRGGKFTYQLIFKGSKGFVDSVVIGTIKTYRTTAKAVTR